MTNENEHEYKNVSDGVNRCRRCNRPLSDPTDTYGWRCAEILGLANYSKEKDELDREVLMLYNEYLDRNVAGDRNDKKDFSTNYNRTTMFFSYILDRGAYKM